MEDCLIDYLKKIEAVANELEKKILNAADNSTEKYLLICRQKGVYDAFYAIQDKLKLPINPPV